MEGPFFADLCTMRRRKAAPLVTCLNREAREIVQIPSGDEKVFSLTRYFYDTLSKVRGVGARGPGGRH